ncbi:MAG: c-type cytochrome [Planctomycetaceae bacterium]|jgi:YVTN family beta-propeller protein|nr:c-type cytochrome [Planctomycetaceae bacterium]
MKSNTILTGLIGAALGVTMTILVLLLSPLVPRGNNFRAADFSFTATDKNKDGAVTQEEFRAFLLADAKSKAIEMRNAVSGSSQNTKSQFISADSNQDGKVSPEELAAYFKTNAVKTTPDPDCPLQGACGDACCHSEYTWENSKPEYHFKGPSGFAASQEGSAVFVVHHDADEIAVLDPVQNKILRTIPVGHEPNGVTLSVDGKTLYVTSGSDRGLLQAFDAESGQRLGETAAGHTPAAPVVTPDGKRLFVCNRFNNNVAEYVLPELKRIRHIHVVREPRGAVVSQDGGKLFVINFLPNDPNNDPEHPDAEIHVSAQVSVIDTVSGDVQNIRLPDGSCVVQGICLSPDGGTAYLTHLVSRYKNATDKLDYGQMNVNAISLLDVAKAEYVNTVLLDDAELGAANPWGITVSRDGSQIFVAIAGTGEVIAIDAAAMHRKLAETQADVSNDFTFLDGIKKRIKLEGKGSRELIAVQDGVYVGMFFNDTLQRIDLQSRNVTEIALGPATGLSQKRAGEMYWNDASLCHQQWQSCASCHPEGCMTGMNWDLLHDGAGNPKNTKSLLFSHDTPPTMWLGDRKHAQQCTRTGFRFIMFTMPQRAPCFTIDEYTREMQPLKSPYLVDGRLSEQALRGKKIFEDEKVGCVHCHSGEYFTDGKMHHVKSRDQYSGTTDFDTPTLIEVWRTAPYLHDGRYVDLRDVFKVGRHGDVAGDVEKLTGEQIDDLVAYVLSL